MKNECTRFFELLIRKEWKLKCLDNTESNGMGSSSLTRHRFAKLEVLLTSE
jgi:hypothetical protein